MIEASFLRKLTSCFDEIGTPYVVVGSISISIQGEPRFTRDVDIVLKLAPSHIEPLVQILSADCYVSETAAREALRNQTMFNVIDYETGGKADLIPIKPEPYAREQFKRRTLQEYAGVKIFCLAAEDVILSKLAWAAITPSDRQLRDALDVARVRWDELDFNYLAKWAPELGVSDALEQLLQETKKMLPDTDPKS